MQISTDVRAVLSSAILDGSCLKLTGQLDRKLYTDVNKVLEAAGGKWNRKAGAHVFDGDASEVIEPILLTGEYRHTKQDFGQFDTPKGLAAQVAELAEIGPGMTVLEPSAGVGRLVQAAIDEGASTIFAYEIDQDRIDTLWKFAGTPTVIIGHTDFLAVDPTPVYDRVLMNPPFAKQADIDHVLHAFKFLKPGGRLVAIMSNGAQFRQDKKASGFRGFVAEHGGQFLPVDPGAFKESGTMVSACIVIICK